MDLIVNSLYSNRDVFLRELVSNGAPPASHTCRSLAPLPWLAAAIGRSPCERAPARARLQRSALYFARHACSVPLAASDALDKVRLLALQDADEYKSGSGERPALSVSVCAWGGGLGGPRRRWLALATAPPATRSSTAASQQP